ncbi:GTP-binding protein, partial [Candidatus Microgenomates bacterium]|nr:GTP-binding protein [Candidatus Microgenomates bacterium]
MNQSQIRNFCIIAHVDHGKSTLADRFIGSHDQFLDSHPISKERGITIRLAPVTFAYKDYEFNLIDTPGHVDFSYEVERSLAACEGAILLVDATAGIQAQTLSHFVRAQRLGLTIIPVVNKIDLPNARVDEVVSELAQLVQLAKSEVLLVSAKTGKGVTELLATIVEKIPPPSGDPKSPLRALVFSSQFETNRGVTAFIRVVDGQIKTKSKIIFLATKSEATAFEIGHFAPAMKPVDTLESGEVGYIVTNLKTASLVKVGDTVSTVNPPTVNPLPGYKEPQPMVFVSLFPVDQNEFYLLEDGLSKLKLNDAALTYVATSSKALGRGFRCGFLGHLHAEVSQERLASDFGLSLIATVPTVNYELDSTMNLREPWVAATIICPSDYLGAVMPLCQDRRGILKNMEY